MRKVILICDGCKQEMKDYTELHEVKLIIVDTYNSNSSTESKIPKVDYCRECLVSKGIATWKANTKPPETPPTIDSIVREIIADELSSRNL